MSLSKAQLALLLAAGMGLTGCQSSPPSTWSWNPWSKKNDASVIAKSGTKPALPSSTASPNAIAGTGSNGTSGSGISNSNAAVNYPLTGTPTANFAQAPVTPNSPAQVGGMGNIAATTSAQTGAYDPNAYARANGTSPNNFSPNSAAGNTAGSITSGTANGTPASYTSSGFGGYGQTAGSVNPTATMAPGSGVAPTIYPQSGSTGGTGGLTPYTPPANTVLPASNYGTGAQPQAGMGAAGAAGSTVSASPFTSQAGQEAAAANGTVGSSSMNDRPAYQAGNTGYQPPNNSYGDRGLITAAPQGTAVAGQYRPGGTGSYLPTGGIAPTGSSVVNANFEAQPNAAAVLPSPYSTTAAYNAAQLQGPNAGYTPAGVMKPAANGLNCENGVCVPNGQQTPQASQAYGLPAQSPAYGAPAMNQPATAMPASGSIYR